MKKQLIILIVIIVAIASFIILRGDSPSETQETQETGKIGTSIGDIAPDFRLPDYEGRAVSLSDFKGQKGVFVNFWASWCPFCVDEMPLMARVGEKYKGQYETMAINRGENLATAKEFSDQVGVTGKMTLLLDEKDSIYKQYNGFAMPYSLFIDKNGVIHDIKLGPLTEQELEQKIQKIIN